MTTCCKSKIVIDTEFQAIIPPLAEEERVQLEANLLADGCRDPLVVWKENGILLDGHNRLVMCRRHGIDYETHEISFESRGDAKIWLIQNQFGRRNLTPFSRAELALKLEPLIATRAKQKQIESGGAVPQKSAKPPVDTREELAQIADVSHDTIHKAKVISEQADEKTKAKLRAGETSINAVYKDVKREQQKKQKREDTEKATTEISAKARENLAQVCDIRHCSMAELFDSGIQADVVITDPPYPKEYLHLYGELAVKCAAEQVPLVAVMCGQSYLPDILHSMTQWLEYRWTMAYLTPGGQAVQQWESKVNTFWKPVLLFGERAEWIGDVAKSAVNDNDKRFHDWGQSESGIADLIEKLTKPGQTVCDPFLGGGTTAAVCLSLGRKFVGGDTDEKSVSKSLKRCEKIYEKS